MIIHPGVHDPLMPPFSFVIQLGFTHHASFRDTLLSSVADAEYVHDAVADGDERLNDWLQHVPDYNSECNALIAERQRSGTARSDVACTDLFDFLV